MLSLDGSYGEGGGQILRTALSLAALTGAPVRIERIRAGRSKPGLRPQHLTAVQAVARISQAEVTGAHLGSQDLTFRPRTLQGGHYVFDVAETTRSAGAVSLIAQALLPPLLKAESPATVILKGGTHVPWSPPAHYLSHVFLPALAAMGAEVKLTLERWGWYPRGGGEVRLTIRPARPLTGVQWRTPADSLRVPGPVRGGETAGARGPAAGGQARGPPGGGGSGGDRPRRRPGPGQPGLSLGAAGGFQRPGGPGQTRGAGGGRGGGGLPGL